MGLWNALTDNKTYNFEQAFGVKDITSSAMRAAIREWFSLYFDTVPPDGEDDCQRLPVVVVNKLYKTAFSEYEATVDGSDFLAKCLANLDGARKRAMQMCLVGGECLLKPVPARDAFRFAVIRRDCFIPLGRDDDGRLTCVGTAETTVDGNLYYTLLERRTVDPGGALTIESRLYRSDQPTVMGTRVPLAVLGKYADMRDTVILPGVWNLGIVPLRTPMENTVDGSGDAVAVYAPAVKLIRNININEQQLCGEFERGESRIIASADMMEVDGTGTRRALRDHVFTMVDDAPEDVGVTIFSPALREASYLARKQEYLRNVESLIGLKRGILSEVEAAERTATEVTSSMGDYSLTIQDFQQAWADMLKELLPTCAVLGKLYGLCEETAFDPAKDLSIDWGNGILYDKDKTWAEIMQMVASRMLKPEIALAWKYDEPWEKPEDLKKIREKYMPELSNMTEDE